MNCTVPGCDRPHRCKGYCGAHYSRWRRTGEPGIAEVQLRRKNALCGVPGCLNDHHARGWCVTHYRRWEMAGDVRPDIAVGTRPRGKAHGRWRGDDGNYQAVHYRLRVERGSATEYACHHCGGVAAEWAYDNSDPDERVHPRGMRFSLDLNHYLALCASCHRKFDLHERAMAKVSS